MSFRFTPGMWVRIRYKPGRFATRDGSGYVEGLIGVIDTPAGGGCWYVRVADGVAACSPDDLEPL